MVSLTRLLYFAKDNRARIVLQQMIPVVGHVRQLFVRSYLTHEIKRSYRSC